MAITPPPPQDKHKHKNRPLPSSPSPTVKAACVPWLLHTPHLTPYHLYSFRKA